MEVTLLAFAQARDQLGFDQITVPCQPEETVRQVLARIAPGFDPSCARVAIDCEYVSWESPIGKAEEIALIPPVSGG
jgi:sulfur-carrier protein